MLRRARPLVRARRARAVAHRQLTSSARGWTGGSRHFALRRAPHADWPSTLRVAGAQRTPSECVQHPSCLHDAPTCGARAVGAASALLGYRERLSRPALRPSRRVRDASGCSDGCGRGRDCLRRAHAGFEGTPVASGFFGRFAASGTRPASPTSRDARAGLARCAVTCQHCATRQRRRRSGAGRSVVKRPREWRDFD